MSLVYHPQTDGQIEVLNKGIENYLRCFAFHKPMLWHKWLPWVEYSYNSFHTSIKTTPFMVVYGWEPLHVIRYGAPKSPMDELDKYL